MKIRNSFVSNSSSSSFIITKKKFKSCVELAMYMLRKRGWDDDNDDIEFLQNFIDHGGDPNATIRFGSCNYDTVIALIDNQFHIDTCHNHDWELDDYGNCMYDYAGNLVDITPDVDVTNRRILKNTYLEDEFESWWQRNKDSVKQIYKENYKLFKP